MRRIATVAIIALVAGAVTLTGGHAGATDTGPFTSTELADNWEADRSAPSDGISSVAFDGRDDVARIGIDNSDPSAGPADSVFFRTEGVHKRDDFGDSIAIDLYLDPDWSDRPVRAGFWAGGWDETATPDPAGRKRSGEFAIIEFTTARSTQFDDPPGSPPFEVTQEDRWRVWHSDVGWVDLPGVSFTYGEWATLEIVFNEVDDTYEYYIDEELVHTEDNSSWDTTHIGEAFLNSYNYAHENVMGSGYTATSYGVHWSLPEIAVTFEGAVKRPEGHRGTRNFPFFLTLDRPARGGETVDYEAVPGSAKRNDFRATSGMVTFAAGETRVRIIVKVNGDRRAERPERFFLELSNPTEPGFVLGDTRGKALIRNDDGPPGGRFGFRSPFGFPFGF